MRHSLSRTRRTFLGDDRPVAPAHPERGSAARASSRVPGPGERRGPATAVCPVSHRTTPRAIRWVALIWALSLGQVSTAGNVAAREEVPSPSDLLRAVSTLRVVSDPRLRVYRFPNGSIQPSSGRPFAFSDDVAWDDPGSNDEEVDESITCFSETVCYLTVIEVRSAPTCTEIRSTPFLQPQPLRC